MQIADSQMKDVALDILKDYVLERPPSVILIDKKNASRASRDGDESLLGWKQ